MHLSQNGHATFTSRVNTDSKSGIQSFVLPKMEWRFKSGLLCSGEVYAQGCQIVLGTKYHNGEKYTKWPLNISNSRKMDQMVIKYIKIFYCKTLQNLPKLGVLV
jgi:hypothetical protein